MNVEKKLAKREIDNDAEKKVEKQQIGLHAEKKLEEQDIAKYSDKKDEKHGVYAVQKDKNGIFGVDVDKHEIHVSAALKEDKRGIYVDTAKTADMPGVTLDAMNIDGIGEMVVDAIEKKNNTNIGVNAVNKADINDDIYLDAPNAEESDDMFVDAADEIDKVDIDIFVNKTGDKNAMQVESTDEDDKDGIYEVSRITEVNVNNDADAANIINKQETKLTSDDSLKPNEELDASSNITKLFAHTDEVIQQENMRTKSVHRCKELTAIINRTREKMKYLKSLQKECSDLCEAYAKVMEIVDMEGATSSCITTLKNLDFFIAECLESQEVRAKLNQSLTTMKELKTKLQKYLAEPGESDMDDGLEELPDVMKSSHSKDDDPHASAFLKKKTPIKHDVQALTGLKNLGNSCYMNSTIQCLNNTLQLVNYFRSDSYRQTNCNRHHGQLVYEFAYLVKDLWSGEHLCIKPELFKAAIGRCQPKFAGSKQEDCQEFLTFLMEGLHEGLNKVKVKKQIQEQTNEGLTDEMAAEISWRDHKLNNDSILVELFQGQFKKTIMCRTCSKQIVDFETFMYLFLPIPNTTYCTLQDCLMHFSAEKSVTGNCLMPAPNCGENSDTFMKLEIWKVPQILIIVLKRFKMEGNWWTKIDAPVDIPTRDVDFSRFVIGPRPKIYNLYAVSNHSGTLSSGHYTACCRNPCNQKWYKFNDSIVQEAYEPIGKSSAAYVLYYTSMDKQSWTPSSSSEAKHTTKK